MAFRVAAASSDGETIDLHFGGAHTFYIYDLEKDAQTFVEKRGLLLENGHSDAKFDSLTDRLSDCDAVLVAQIGPGAARHVLQSGLRVFEAPYALQPVLQKLRHQLFEEEPSAGEG